MNYFRFCIFWKVFILHLLFNDICRVPPSKLFILFLSDFTGIAPVCFGLSCFLDNSDVFLIFVLLNAMCLIFQTQILVAHYLETRGLQFSSSLLFITLLVLILNEMSWCCQFMASIRLRNRYLFWIPFPFLFLSSVF